MRMETMEQELENLKEESEAEREGLEVLEGEVETLERVWEAERKRNMSRMEALDVRIQSMISRDLEREKEREREEKWKRERGAEGAGGAVGSAASKRGGV